MLPPPRLPDGSDPPPLPRRPLFRDGTFSIMTPQAYSSSRRPVDQLRAIFNVMGAPSDAQVARVATRSAEAGERVRAAAAAQPPLHAWPDGPAAEAEALPRWRALYPGAPDEALLLLQALLRFEPEARASSRAALRARPFFAVPAALHAAEEGALEGAAPLPPLAVPVTAENVRELMCDEIAAFNGSIPEEQRVWYARNAR